MGFKHASVRGPRKPRSSFTHLYREKFHWRPLGVKKIASTTDPLWYKDAIIYELHVRAFADSNNDGIGDLPGLLSRLEYLKDLGITCIWLLPFFPSPFRDDGYDISNYTDVHPAYGTLSDFKAFLDAAHLRGLQVMIELVVNHTSDQHPWFKAARLAPPGSAERKMYVWSTAIKSIRTRASSSLTRKNRTGPGTILLRHITGIGSFRISRISITIIRW